MPGASTTRSPIRKYSDATSSWPTPTTQGYLCHRGPGRCASSSQGAAATRNLSRQVAVRRESRGFMYNVPHRYLPHKRADTVKDNIAYGRQQRFSATTDAASGICGEGIREQTQTISQSRILHQRSVDASSVVTAKSIPTYVKEQTQTTWPSQVRRQH